MGNGESAEQSPVHEHDQMQSATGQRVVQVGAPPPQRYIAEHRTMRLAGDRGFSEWNRSSPPLANHVPSMQIQSAVRCYIPVALKADSLSMRKASANDHRYGLWFTYDASVAAKIVVYFLATEEVDERTGIRFTSERKFERLCPQGMKQEYRSLMDEYFKLESIPKDTLRKFAGPHCAHFVIELHPVGDGSTDSANHQITYANIAHNQSDPTRWKLVGVKQKVRVGKTVFDYQAMYGIGAAGPAGDGTQEEDNSGRECAICLTDPRDTAVLPCRHLCVCSGCADMVRRTSNKCPICREPVSSFLQIAVKDTQ